MKRSRAINVLSHDNLVGFKQKVVYHEAGHATGIYFNNIHTKLPPIFFEIIFKPAAASSIHNLLADLFDPYTLASIRGGRLIASLPLLTFKVFNAQLNADTYKRAFRYTDEYRLAFEADITNLLIGSLAEAKYTALLDNEPFNQNLLSVQALKYYGGDADLAVINDYLQSYTADELEQHKILDSIFIKAFNFVNDRTNWKAISHLANYILTSNKNSIGCAEVAVVLDGKWAD